jgi:hypothetical protein
LEIHHIVHRANGGGHEAGNLLLVCSACHSAHHQGQLRIRGTAEALDVERCAERRSVSECATGGTHVGAKSVERGDGVVCAQAIAALIQLGWRPAIAGAAVKSAVQTIGNRGEIELEKLIFEALRRCPQRAA